MIDREIKKYFFSPTNIIIYVLFLLTYATAKADRCLTTKQIKRLILTTNPHYLTNILFFDFVGRKKLLIVSRVGSSRGSSKTL